MLNQLTRPRRIAAAAVKPERREPKGTILDYIFGFAGMTLFVIASLVIPKFHDHLK